ncbi:hypothetical protein HOI18_03485 [Candidatus Uhrbacteria bacterium]|nr:hypothetical protein [Candidatus Uhrbacteria bacterium]
MQKVEAWNESCQDCGFHLVLEPDEKRKVRYLRTPALGALLWTQGWTFGARLYFWFLLSLVPVFGIIALVACLIFGRRWAWKYGGWDDWGSFTERMRVMDAIGVIWILGLMIGYVWIRYGGGL